MASLLYTLLVARSEYSDARNYRDACTKETCPLSTSYWAYLPSLPANGLFLALFSLSLLWFLVQTFLSKRFLGFSIAMICGCVLEVLGYVGRIMSWYNPFSENGFLIQIVCLTIAPAFLAAGIYLCLSRIVLTFGESNSRIAAKKYPQIFIPCDVVSLLLQAAGGGLASAMSHADKDPSTGNHIMQAGLAAQVLTLLIFIGLSVDFGVKTYSRYSKLSTEAFDERHAALRQSKKFKAFLVALGFATLCIFTRSVYRVAELSEGWNGRLISTQSYFIGLEGAIVSAGVLALNVAHPGVCFREGDVKEERVAGGGKRGFCGLRKKGEKSEGSERSSSGEGAGVMSGEKGV